MSSVERPTAGTTTLPPLRADEQGPIQKTGQVQGAPRATQLAPPPAGSDPPVGDVPVLSLPRNTDSTDLLLQALTLKIKNGDQQLSASMQEVQHNSEVQKTKNDEIAKKLQDNLDKMAESKGLSGFLKALQWIGVALAVLVAAVTMNPVAIAGAVMAVTMAVLNDTGVMNKMGEAITNSLIKDGMDPSEAKKWGMALTVVIGVAASLVGLGAGAASSATTGAAKLAELAEKLGEVATKVATAAKVAQTVTTVAQAGTSVGKAVIDHQAADSQAEVADLKAFLAKLKQAQDDEMDRIQNMVEQAAAVVSKAMATLGRVNDTSSNIIRHMA